jgi:hypothetical protein
MDFVSDFEGTYSEQVKLDYDSVSVLADTNRALTKIWMAVEKRC